MFVMYVMFGLTGGLVVHAMDNNTTSSSVIELNGYDVISSCTTKEIPNEFRWEEAEQCYVWDTNSTPVNDGGVAIMKTMFKHITDCSQLSDGSIVVRCDEIFAIKWHACYVVDGGNNLPNPEKWIESYYVSDLEVGYHAYIGDDEQYYLMVSNMYFDFAVQPYDEKWTWYASELVPSEDCMSKLQEYLSKVHSQQVNELSDGSYEICVDEYYRLFINDVCVGTACYGIRVTGKVDDNQISKIKEILQDENNYVEKAITTNGQTQIYVKSFSNQTEYVICVEPKIINDAFLSSEVISNFYIDGMIYNLYSSVRYDGQKFIYITMENRN